MSKRQLKILFMNANNKSTIKHFILSLNSNKVTIKILLLILLFTTSISAQETLVVGQVLNSADKRPVPNVNISFKNSQTGVQSNEEGYFMIRTNDKQTTLLFSSIGYKKHAIRIKP